ncbi:protein disulfide-isomerase TMX3-like [Diachasmimorpha longicaudata]|uniref:protein disulfide-isomerase TMX3-like n=1 Tax=Diachasmimorpha longicaudata TaxID=58733 RepID=UPI0030B86DE7
MISIHQIVSLSYFCGFLSSQAASEVVELNDKFLDTYKEGRWLVMICAPWDTQCQQLEPIWADISQDLEAVSMNVGRLDGTKFTSVSEYFGVQTYPTILFTKGDKTTIYTGDQTHEELVKFALRVNGPLVQEITKASNFDKIKNFLDLYFLYIGERSGDLWDVYERIAEDFQPFVFFYQAHPAMVESHAPKEKVPAILVYKENEYYGFTGNNETDLEKLYSALHTWVNEERFLTFPQVTRGNIQQLSRINKYLAMAVIDENASVAAAPALSRFRENFESIIKEKRDKYHNHFQFCWIAKSELLHSIVVLEVPMPSLIVVNTSSSLYHAPEDDLETLTPQAIETFLEHIMNNTAPKIGGEGLVTEIYRYYLIIKRSIINLWKESPLLLFAHLACPTLLFLYSCGISCCACPLHFDDDDEEEDESE